MKLNKTNYLNSCRICLEISEKTEFFDLYSATIRGTSSTYAEALSLITGIQIEESNDGALPRNICVSCCMRVSAARSLVCEALKSYNVLLNIKTTNVKDDDPLKVEVTEVAEEVEEEEIEALEHDEETYPVEVTEEYEESVKPDPAQQPNADESECSNSAEVIEEYLIMDPEEVCEDAVQFMINNLMIRTQVCKPVSKKQAPSKVRNHKCEVCGRAFLRRSNLIDHLRLHANVKIFECEICEKAFVQAGNLKSHLRTHTNEKPFECNMCGKSYSQSSALKTHIKSHENLKNHVCDVCPKAFTNTSDLYKHKLIHSKVKNFKCVICPGRFFTQKIHLKKHAENYHSEMNIDKIVETGTLKTKKK